MLHLLCLDGPGNFKFQCLDSTIQALKPSIELIIYTINYLRDDFYLLAAHLLKDTQLYVVTNIVCDSVDGNS